VIKRERTHWAVQAFNARFRERRGSTYCRELPEEILEVDESRE